MANERLAAPSAFDRLPQKEKESFFYHFHEIEINLGCGSRPCRMCCYNAPKYKSSLPSSVIKEMHTLKQEIAPSVSFWHYRAGDPFYWRDEKTGETYADIAIDAYEKKLGLAPIPTHGWLPDEEIPQKAASQLVEWAKGRGKRNLVDLSIDPYGFIGVPPEIHDASISQTAAILEPILGHITAFYNPQDENEGGKEQVQSLIARTIPQHLQSKIKYEDIFGAGRALHLNSKPDLTLAPSTIGYSIRYDGKVVFTQEMNGEESTIGTVFSGLKTPLPLPIPRAPYFD